MLELAPREGCTAGYRFEPRSDPLDPCWCVVETVCPAELAPPSQKDLLYIKLCEAEKLIARGVLYVTAS